MADLGAYLGENVFPFLLPGLIAAAGTWIMNARLSRSSEADHDYAYRERARRPLCPGHARMLAALETGKVRRDLLRGRYRVIEIVGPDRIGRETFAAHLYGSLFRERRPPWTRWRYLRISGGEAPSEGDWIRILRGQEDQEAERNGFYRGLLRRRSFLVVRGAELLERGPGGREFRDLVSRCARTPGSRIRLVLLRGERGGERGGARLTAREDGSWYVDPPADPQDRSLRIELPPLDRTDFLSGDGRDLVLGPEEIRLLDENDWYPSLWEAARSSRGHAVPADVWADVEEGIRRKTDLLSREGREILSWLALWSPRTVSELRDLCGGPEEARDAPSGRSLFYGSAEHGGEDDPIDAALSELESRFLIDLDGRRRTVWIRETVRRAVRERMIGESAEAVLSTVRSEADDGGARVLEAVRALDRWPLYEACAGLDRAREQRRGILLPILRRLEGIDAGGALRDMLSAARSRTGERWRYAVPDLLALMVCGGWSLRDLDLSGLDLGQADLEDADLRGVALVGSDLRQVRFSQLLGDTIARSCAFHPGGRWYVTGGENGKLLFWDVRTRQKLAQVLAHRDAIRDLAFFPDVREEDPEGRERYFLASCGNDGDLSVWDCRDLRGPGPTGEIPAPVRERRIPGPGGGVRLTCLAVSGTLLASGSEDGRIWCRDWTRDAPPWTVEMEGSEAPRSWYRLRFAPDGRYLLAGGSDGAVTAFLTDRRARRLVPLRGAGWTALDRRRPGASPGAVCALAIGRDGEDLLTGAGDGVLERWRRVPSAPDAPLEDLRWEKRWTRRAHTGMVTGAALLDDGSAVTCGHDGQIHRWAPDGRPVPSAGGPEDRHSARIHAMDLLETADPGASPPGRALTCGGDDSIRLWGLDLAPLSCVQGKSIWVDRLLSFESPAWPGDHLAIGCSDGTVRIWRMEGGGDARTAVPVLDRPMRCPAAVTALDLSPDRRILAAGLRDGRVVLWDLDRARELYTVQAHEGEIRGLSFLSCPEGAPEGGGRPESGDYRLLTASADGARETDRARIWTFRRMDRDDVLMERPAGTRGFCLYLGGLDAALAVTPEGLRKILGPLLPDAEAVLPEDGPADLTFRTRRERIVPGIVGGDGVERDLPLSLDLRGIPIHALRISPDREWLAAAGEDGRLYCWDLFQTERESWRRRVFQISGSYLRQAAFDRGSRYLAVVDGLGVLTVLPTEGIREAMESDEDDAVLPVRGAQATLSREHLRAVTFSADGRTVAAAGASGKLLLCRIEGSGQDLHLQRGEALNLHARYRGLDIRDAVLPRIRADGLEALAADGREVE